MHIKNAVKMYIFVIISFIDSTEPLHTTHMPLLFPVIVTTKAF